MKEPRPDSARYYRCVDFAAVSVEGRLPGVRPAALIEAEGVLGPVCPSTDLSRSDAHARDIADVNFSPPPISEAWKVEVQIVV